MLDQIANITVAFTGITAVILAASQEPRVRMWGGIFGLLGEPCWFITAYLHDQWGIIVLVFVYAAGWIRVVYKNYVAHGDNQKV